MSQNHKFEFFSLGPIMFWTKLAKLIGFQVDSHEYFVCRKCGSMFCETHKEFIGPERACK